MDYPGWWNDGCGAERHPVRVRLIGRRLLVTAAEAADSRLARRYYARRSTLYRFAAWTGALLATLALLFGAVQFGAEPLAALVPVAREERLGTELMAGFVDEYGACETNPALGHLQDLVDELAAPAESPYRFRVHVLAVRRSTCSRCPAGGSPCSTGS